MLPKPPKPRQEKIELLFQKMEKTAMTRNPFKLYKRTLALDFSRKNQLNAILKYPLRSSFLELSSGRKRLTKIKAINIHPAANRYTDFQPQIDAKKLDTKRDNKIPINTPDIILPILLIPDVLLVLTWAIMLGMTHADRKSTRL